MCDELNRAGPSSSGSLELAGLSAGFGPETPLRFTEGRADGFPSTALSSAITFGFLVDMLKSLQRFVPFGNQAPFAYRANPRLLQQAFRLPRGNPHSLDHRDCEWDR